MEDTRENKDINAAQHVLKDDPQALEVARIMRNRIDTNNVHRRANLAEINANISYLVGEQNVCFRNGAIEPITNVRLRNPVSNIILPAVQKDVAVATQSPPVYDFVPAGTDDDDRATATVAHKFIQHIQRMHGTGLARSQTVMWYDIAGVGWRKVYWNPNYMVKGINPPPTDPETGELNPDHNPQLEVGEAIMQGEVEIESVPPFQLIYDFRQTNLRKLEWIIHAKPVTREWVLSTFGFEVTQALSGNFSSASKESEFEATIINRFNGGVADEIQQVVTPKPRNDSHVMLKADEYIEYYEYWQKPTKSAPAGMLAIMLGDQVVTHGPYPMEYYPHGELPFTPAAPLSIGAGVGTAIPRISSARPIQRRYNRLLAQIDENVDVMGNAIIMAPRNSKIKYKTLDNGAGNLIEYDGPVGKPHREAGVPMNPQIFAYISDTKQTLEQLFAFNEVTRGVAPRNIESGRGIMALQDADRVHMQPIVLEFEEADRHVAYQAVTIAMENYEEERQIDCVGTDFSWALYTVDKNQLRGKFNVVIKPLSSLPTDKEADAIRAFEAWKSGLLGDPNEPDIRLWTLEQMRMGNQENLLQKNSKQRNFAAKEFLVAADNVKKFDLPPDSPAEVVADEIKKRTFIPHINAFDDHQVHLAVHGEWMMDNYWELISYDNPIMLELLQNMMLHIQEHQAVIQQQQSAAFERDLQAQMLIKGTTMPQIALRKASGASGQSNSQKGN